MKIAIVHDSPRVTDSSKRLLMEVKSTGNNAYYLRISKMGLKVGDYGCKFTYGSKELPKLDGAIIRNLGFLLTIEQMAKRMDVLRELKDEGTYVINDPDSMTLARDKLGSILRLRRAGIPVPETAVAEDPFDVMRLVEEWGEVVIKPIMGSLGLGAIKVSDPDVGFRVAKSVLAVNQPLYVQRYIRKPDRDIRVFVVGDEVVGGIYRVNKSHWKTNIAQGATAQLIEPAVELYEFSIKVTKAMGLDYAGVDIVEDVDGTRRVLEVNASPLWEGIESATKKNVARHIVDYLLKKTRK
ncbi:ATP-grasp domain-containing protein [Sulfodiicoccus acidiphilus]|uniref:ATP-grasp domain-containing protein n=1 Tax=Sulfodiicoccus acidiphilus TaxID=1670455 RepID=UPI000F827B92|nr:RimK family alpha-L-glutamate ligase [Sulfodiicoccus acidiphilus]